MALAVLELLAEGPKHPYEIKQLMHELGIAGPSR
jgi:DNA-binding PadR family transcriptional regulator